MKRRRSTARSDGVLGIHVLREVLFESGQFFAANELCALDDFEDRLVDLIFDAPVLSFEINKWNSHEV